MCSGQCIDTKVLYAKPSECLCLNRIAPHCTQVRYGAITARNRCENYVLHRGLQQCFSKNYLSA